MLFCTKTNKEVLVWISAAQPSLFGTTAPQPTTGFGAQTSAFGSTFGTPATQVS